MSTIAGANIKKDNLNLLFDPINSKSIQPENLFTFSEDFLNAAWVKDLEVLFSTTLETQAPDGTYNATKMVLNPRYKGAIPIYRTVNITPLLRYTESVYLKYAGMRYAFFWFDTGGGNGCTVEVDLLNGTMRNTRIGDSIYYTSFNTGIESVGNGWYRVYISGIPTAIQSNVSPRIYCSNTATGAIFNFGNPVDYNENGKDGIYIWGWQIEQSNIPTTYTKTTSSTVVRSVIDLSGNSNNGTFTSGAGIAYSDKSGYYLDGVNDTITTNIPLTNYPALSSWTMSVWAKPTSLPANLNNGVILGAVYYAGTAIYWRTASGIFTVYGNIRGMDGAKNTAVYNCTINQTYNFVTVNDRSDNTFKLYVNGILHSSVSGPTQGYDSTSTYNPTLTAMAGNIGISKNQIDGGGSETYTFFPGVVYGANLYSSALSAAEVAQNFNAYRDRYGI